MIVISKKARLRNLFKEEFKVLNKKIFQLRCAALNMTVNDCHSDNFVISMDKGLRNLLQQEFKILIKNILKNQGSSEG